jgi:hypothetical protein
MGIRSDISRRHMLALSAAAVTLAAAAVTPAFAQAVGLTAIYGEGENAQSIPDFSGFWMHPLPGFEPLSSGPTALVNRSRRANGTGDILRLAGDYTNPILKPAAVEVVKRHAELGLNGIAIRTRATSVGPEGCRSCLRMDPRSSSSSRTRSPFFMPTIIKSATCA